MYELAHFISSFDKSKFAVPEALTADIQKAARNSYCLLKTVKNSIIRILTVSTVSIQSYMKQLKSLDKSISALMETIPSILTSINSVCSLYAARILLEIGSISRFKEQVSLAKYTGLAWSRYQSSNYDIDNTRMVNSSNRYLRYYLIESANLVQSHDPKFKRFYKLKCRETPKTPHKRVLGFNFEITCQIGLCSDG